VDGDKIGGVSWSRHNYDDGALVEWNSGYVDAHELPRVIEGLVRLQLK